MVGKQLDFYAGTRALQRIRSEGLKADDIRVMAGAAGGPKWLILGQLDRALFSSWFKGRKKPLYLVGSSSGAWRFAMAAQTDPAAAVTRFAHAYIHQYYTENPTPADIRREAIRILDEAVPKGVAADILGHPFLRINIMAVRCKGPVASDVKPIQTAGMLAAMALNTIRRRGLGLLFDRVLFYDPRNRPPIGKRGEFPLVRVSLSRANFQPALMASGAIPLIMPGVTGIAGAPPGIYRDGGVIDYHMDLPWSLNDGIVLFPHYSDRIIPGWLDKRFTWRHPSPLDAVDLLMVCPSKAFLASLPYGKIPDRNDFYRLAGKDKERVAYWWQAYEAGQRLGDEFMTAVLSGRIREWVRPLPWA